MQDSAPDTWKLIAEIWNVSYSSEPRGGKYYWISLFMTYEAGNCIVQHLHGIEKQQLFADWNKQEIDRMSKRPYAPGS